MRFVSIIFKQCRASKQLRRGQLCSLHLRLTSRWSMSFPKSTHLQKWRELSVRYVPYQLEVSNGPFAPESVIYVLGPLLSLSTYLLLKMTSYSAMATNHTWGHIWSSRGKLSTSPIFYYVIEDFVGMSYMQVTRPNIYDCFENVWNLW